MRSPWRRRTDAADWDAVAADMDDVGGALLPQLLTPTECEAVRDLYPDDWNPDKLDKIFRERPALHRFPGNMARRVQAMTQAVVKDYGGDAGAVWRDARDGDDLAKRISKLPGFGEMKTKIMISVLAKKFDVKPAGWEKHAASWHSVADVDSPETMLQARAVKREMKAAQKS